MTTAIVFVPTSHLLPDAEKGINHCLAHGYEMIGVVKDDWGKAMEYLHDGTADVLVVADDEHLDPDREPRIEVVNQRALPATPPRNAGPVPRRQRRPNQI